MEFNRYVVDSSVFIAFYRDTDSQHKEALRIMQELAEATLIIHPYVIQETTTVLAYGAGVQLAKQFLSDIENASNVQIASVFVEADMQAFRDFNAKLSFTDTALIRLARERGCHLITLDRQMLRLSKKLA